MEDRESEAPVSLGMVGGVSAFGVKPDSLVLALKEVGQGGGLLLWAHVRDPAARQWAEVSPMAEAEAELRGAVKAAVARAMEEAPEGAEVKVREARALGLPKVEVSPNGRVRVDVIWSRVQHHFHLTTLTPTACAAIWKLWVEALPVAEIPRALPETIRVSIPHDGDLAGTGYELEKELEEDLIRNWDKIPLSSGLETPRRQYPTSYRGRIDLLCKNKDGSGYTVIELKRGQTSFAALGQVQTYMAWVRGNMVKEDQSVWGIIVCRDPDPRLMEARREAPNVDVYTYVRQGQSVVLTKKN